jgi:hypothetical protein
VAVNYQYSKMSNGSSIISTSNELPFRKKISTIENSQLEIKNSFFTPVTFRNEFDQRHLIFFSGGQIIGNGICGDIFLHDMIISEDGNFDLTVFTQYRIPEISYPLNDYGAFLLSNNETYFYFLHGGISCDLQTTFSDLFAIEIMSKMYIKVSQNKEIA